VVDEEVQALVDLGGVCGGEPGMQIGDGLELLKRCGLLLALEGVELRLCLIFLEFGELGIDAAFAFGVAGEIPLPGKVGIFEAGELGFESG